MISLIDETGKTVQRISSELRTVVLDDLGLIAALEWHGQELSETMVKA
jgi:signal transduction histidine kinase